MIAAWLDRYQPVWLEHLRLGAPLKVGPTGEIALAIFARWVAGVLFVQLVSRIDEASTHADSPYMIMAGYAARLGQWNRFDTKWRKGLRKAGLTYFHAKEHWRNPFSEKGPQISGSNLMFGFVARLDRADYEKFYRGGGGWGGKGLQPDSMYGLCFRYCLSFVLQRGRREIPRDDLKLNFIIESGHENEGAPNAIVRELKRKRLWGVSEFLGTVTPKEKMEDYGLQAADGLAYGSWYMEQPEDSPLLGSPVYGPPWQGTKAPIFRCHLDGRELATFKDGYFEHVRSRREFGHAKHGTRPK